jgi:hypothetical protein
VTFSSQADTAALVGSVSSNCTGRCVFLWITMARESTWFPWVISRTRRADEIAAAQLAVDGQVEHGKVTDRMGFLKADADGPDVLGLERWLLADEFSLVPGFALVGGFHDRLLGC